MANEDAMIKLRLDVDYPYPSMAKNYLYIALGIKNRKGKDFLKNARIIARMINESPKEVKAYWFFTPYTIPDKKLLDLLTPDRHEVALHVANNAFREWKNLENETGRKVTYYTIHGTSRLLTQLLWRRRIGERQAKIPSEFPLKSFHEKETYSLDIQCYRLGLDGGKKEAEKWINQNYVISVHPEWLFKKGKRSGRGPFYGVFKSILEVDKELETLRIRKTVFAKVAHDTREYERSIVPTNGFIGKIGDRDVDIFTFIERKWCCPLPNPPSTWIKTKDNVGLLDIKDYAGWWSDIGKKTRNMVRRAEKSGVNVTVVQPGEKLAEGIWKIYNETPIRQKTPFPHYGEPLQTISGNMFKAKNSTFIGAFLQEELAGFIQIIHGDNIAVISQILSMQKYWDKALNNALLAKAVEVCASGGTRWLMYGRIGNHPSLDKFKESNGFVKYPVTRYYVPLTWMGNVAVRLGLHMEPQDALPEWLKKALPQSLKDLLITVAKQSEKKKTRLKLYSRK